MKITIEVPEMKCAKCSATAPIQPVFIYARGVVPPQFRDMLSDAVKEREDVRAADSSGRAWAAFADDKPVGWTKGPGQADLCTACTALWAEAGKAFLTPSAEILEASVLKAAPMPAPSVSDKAMRPPTMSEIIAARNYEDKTPNNSLMPMASPLRR